MDEGQARDTSFRGRESDFLVNIARQHPAVAHLLATPQHVDDHFIPVTNMVPHAKQHNVPALMIRFRGCIEGRTIHLPTGLCQQLECLFWRVGVGVDTPLGKHPSISQVIANCLATSSQPRSRGGQIRRRTGVNRTLLRTRYEQMFGGRCLNVCLGVASVVHAQRLTA